MSNGTVKSMSISSKSSAEDNLVDDTREIDADSPNKPTKQQAKPWPEDASDFLSTHQDASRSFTSGLFHYACHVLSSPRRFVSAQENALLYSYMSPILRHGATNHTQRKALLKNKKNETSADSYVVNELSKEDLYIIPTSMEAQRLEDLFWSSRSRYPSNGPSALSFLKILWIIAKPTYIPSGYWQFITVVCQCSLPLLVRQVLRHLEQNPSEPFRKEGLCLALAIFAVSLLQGVGDERQKFLAFRTGITLRSAVVSAAHAHLLNMTPHGRAGLASGEITNLVAVDAQKLFELAQEGHYSWACPLAMIIVSVLLLLELGPAAVVGIITMFLIVPMVQSVVRKIMSIRKHRVGVADKRIEIINSLLQGIRFTKLNRYEERFMKRIMELRRVETRLLMKELFFYSLTIFATIISPILASCLTFIAYALMDEENVLTTSLTFTSIFLFAALRFPINYAGKFMGKAAQGLQACSRFSSFFERESVADLIFLQNGKIEQQTPHIPDTGNIDIQYMSSTTKSCSQDTSSSLINVKASFCAELSIEGAFVLHDIELSVQRSEIMCVVGPVASGKSTLVQGLIGEILPIPTTKEDTVFDVYGKVSYASQIPFILNATVRENILFGEPYDEELYDCVLEACCLKADIDQFHSGDLTEIGERGVTLSGGQKARLSLARVAYSQPDVAILDDPLSALDAGTGKQVFEKLFKPTSPGLFSNTAVVLVTHASHFLKRVDSLLVLVNGKSVFVGKWGDLSSCHPTDPSELDAIEAIRSSVQEEHNSESDANNAANSKTQPVCFDTTGHRNESQSDQEEGRIMTQEERKYGLSQLSSWISWFSYAGGWMFFFILLITMTIDRYLYVAIELWIGQSRLLS